MFTIRKPTMLSMVFVLSVVCIAWFLIYRIHPLAAYWAVPIWLMPAALAHMLRSNKGLFLSCIALNIGLEVVCTVVLNVDSDVTWIGTQAYYASRGIELFVFPPLRAWWDSIAYSFLTAPLSGLVGVAYARTCAEQNAEKSRPPSLFNRATAAVLIYGLVLWSLAALLQRLI